MENMAIHIHELLIKETKRRILYESIPRIRKCLSMLSEEQVWFRPNLQSNSAGNLVLHVCGNARQWICSGLGNQPDYRNRHAEFAEKGPLSNEKLFALLDNCENDIEIVLDSLVPEQLIKAVKVQGFDETGISVLIHVVEHFSYHTGQIAYLTKGLKNISTGFYDGLNLDSTG
jgi:uncharacterized damage-inducible protein DinB